MIQDLGIELVENPDLHPEHLMIHAGDPDRALPVIQKLAVQDAVAYIFPAWDDLVTGAPTRPYADALTPLGVAAQLIPTNGPGWGGTDHNAATVGYVLGQLSDQLATGAAEAAIQRAMAQWSNVVQVTWQQGTDATAPQTVNILFASGDHGDGLPFTSTTILAHTFYPAPPNPEPIAGDMHFNADETWQIGANTDLFSVALHELGHALGLGHSDSPSDVMYPYYKMVTTLNSGDIATVQTLYPAAEQPAPAPAPTPTPTPTRPQLRPQRRLLHLRAETSRRHRSPSLRPAEPVSPLARRPWFSPARLRITSASPP
jgi:hypothetical protein